MSAAYFTTDDGRWFQPTALCRGPWHIDHCHAGPPSGLAARALAALAPDQPLRRLTVELLRPVPMAGFAVAAALSRAGRSVSTGAGELIDGEGRVCARFTGTLVAVLAPPLVLDGGARGAGGAPMGTVEAARAGAFPIARARHGERFFAHSARARYPVGEGPGPGPTRVWLRTARLLAGEPGRGFERIAPLADCGNAFARQCEPFAPLSFANADLSVSLHREPVGDWFGMAAHSRWEVDGVGLSDAQLFDRRGAVGRALQTVVLREAGQ